MFSNSSNNFKRLKRRAVALFRKLQQHNTGNKCFERKYRHQAET
jgi:hypothetical protein